MKARAASLSGIGMPQLGKVEGIVKLVIGLVLIIFGIGFLIWLFAFIGDKVEAAKREKEQERLRQEAMELERLNRLRDVSGLPPLPPRPGDQLKKDKLDAEAEVDLAACSSCQAEQPLWGLSIFKPPQHWAAFNQKCAPVQKLCAKHGISYNIWSVDKLIAP